MRRRLISLLIGLTLAACGGAPREASQRTATLEATSSSQSGAGTPEMTSSSQSGSATPEAPLSSKVAVLTRSGGFIGLHEVLTVQSDGQVVLDREGQVKTGQIEKGIIEALQKSFNSPEWNALEPKYGRQFPDAFAYTIEAGGKTVTTYDGAQNPEPLAAVLDQLLDLLQAAGSGAGES